MNIRINKKVKKNINNHEKTIMSLFFTSQFIKFHLNTRITAPNGRENVRSGEVCRTWGRGGGEFVDFGCKI